MITRVKNFNREAILWSIDRADKHIEELYHHFPKLSEWIEGQKNPTVKQLQKFAHKVKVPFGYLFFDELPSEELDFPFFRTLKGETRHVPLNLFDTIQMLKIRQSWLREYLIENEFEELKYVGKYTLNTDNKTIINDIRETLDLTEFWADSLSTWRDSIQYLTEKIGKAGINICFNSVVGNNTHRKIEVEQCRGFVLVDEYAPFMFINSADAKAAQIFTIAHELVHIWLGKSAGFDFRKLQTAEDPMEKKCDTIAAEFLVPKVLLNELSQDYSINDLSRKFKVSEIVIARRLLDENLMTRKSFFSFYNKYKTELEDRKSRKTTSGGDFYATARKRIGERFARFVKAALKNNQILYTEAYDLTGLKGGTFNKFVNEELSADG